MNTEETKNLKSIMKSIYDKNHPTLTESVYKKYISLNDVLGKYQNFLNRINKIRNVSNWGMEPLEYESYNSADHIFEKIRNDLKKGFEVVPYNLYSIEIDIENDSIRIRYSGNDKTIRDYEITNFLNKVNSKFTVDDFKIKNNPLDFPRILEHIIEDINSYWIKNILTFIDEVKKINEMNKTTDEINKMVLNKNKKSIEPYLDHFKKLNELNVIFPIRLENGEIFFPSKINKVNDYVLISKEGKSLIKIINNEKVDKSITTLLFDKCKVDKSSVPSWIYNDRLFTNLDDLDNDLILIKSELEKFKNIYKNVPPYKELYGDKKIEEKKYELNEVIDISKLKEKIYNALEKSNSKITKKLEIPDMILFCKNNDGIKVIDEKFLPYLKNINLSTNIFDNVWVKDVDFSDCNPKLLDPQTVYEKDLSGTKFNSYPFIKKVSFENVNLSDAIIIIKEDVDIDLSNAYGNISTYVNINDKEIEIRVKNKKY